MDNATKMEVQEVFACCGFNDKTPPNDPKMGHPSCEAVKVINNTNAIIRRQLMKQIVAKMLQQSCSRELL